MQLSPQTLTTATQYTPAHWGLRLVLCILLCWSVFHGLQGMQTTAQVHSVRVTVECFGACSLDAVMEADVSIETTNNGPTCSRDEHRLCETDNNDWDFLHSWEQSISAANLMIHLNPLVPADEFEHTPLHKPPRLGT